MRGNETALNRLLDCCSNWKFCEANEPKRLTEKANLEKKVFTTKQNVAVAPSSLKDNLGTVVTSNFP